MAEENFINLIFAGTKDYDSESGSRQSENIHFWDPCLLRTWNYCCIITTALDDSQSEAISSIGNT